MGVGDPVREDGTAGGGDMSKVIYIAGAIKNASDYWIKFDVAEAHLKFKGWTVLNPTSLPEGMSGEKYMPICLAMVQAADAIFMLKGFEASMGANVERDFALYQQKEIYYSLEDVPKLEEEP